MKKTFKQWMQEVDEKIGKKAFGLSSADLSDQCYYDWWEDGVSSASAANRALKAEGFGRC